MEATQLSDQLIEELRCLGRTEKLRLLQILVDELAVDTTVSETLAPFGNAAAVDALSEMLRDAGESTERNN